MEFVGDVAADAIEETSEGYSVTLPWTLAERLLRAGPNQAAYLTIDGPGGRWSGPLVSWEARRVGECPHCSHCMEKVVVSEWRDKPW
ncbi:hypothetical protein [Nocardia wallacei]|uniref:hypothetical protein n=1 Tax=Nocardia wallacei TaxID=480035 RepID=UPI002456E451|nr:hypothetical protein [Nocardia wallacei]